MPLLFSHPQTRDEDVAVVITRGSSAGKRPRDRSRILSQRRGAVKNTFVVSPQSTTTLPTCSTPSQSQARPRHGSGGLAPSTQESARRNAARGTSSRSAVRIRLALGLVALPFRATQYALATSAAVFPLHAGSAVRRCNTCRIAGQSADGARPASAQRHRARSKASSLRCA